MASYGGFAEEDFDSVFITLDKMDKIGVDSCAEELERNGYAKRKHRKILGIVPVIRK